ncbi:alpha/beta hydrolase [Paenibacillus chondroitinus]|uniref:Alpha/beta hydrolase n=1 Tax=Paenibacillus chondroitinus TaxID=59842 RepID=A0ABU6D3L4_9BACL|nr:MULTISPECIES: alpha/beta hydrolase [Paenibacillus]MCY9660889.1 alpha/beta hydrolase [Paenibacillus anseongense]MEB4792313.1 alpha/beta hydrolase [Paenibacillus chondroitinus]
MPFAHLKGTILNYEISGTGIPIVFIHPPLLTSEAFFYQKKQLSHHFQVITFDIRGHGSSQASERPLSMELMAHDVRMLLDEIGIEKAYLCGYSTGGMVLLEALLAYPERFLGGIVVSGMSELTDVYNKIRVWMACNMTGPVMLMDLLKKAITNGNADNHETYRQLYESAKKDTSNDVCMYFKQTLAYSCTHRLRNIKHPILLMFGRKDRSFHRYAHLLHQGLPHSSLYFLKDAKHQIPIKNAAKMNDLIRLWVESLEDQHTERGLLDLAIARKMNPAMYGEDTRASEETGISPD